MNWLGRNRPLLAALASHDKVSVVGGRGALEGVDGFSHRGQPGSLTVDKTEQLGGPAGESTFVGRRVRGEHTKSVLSGRSGAAGADLRGGAKLADSMTVAHRKAILPLRLITTAWVNRTPGGGARRRGGTARGGTKIPGQPLGSLGRRFDRRSPFYVGLVASAGVAVTYGAVRVLESVSSILLLIGVAFFLALGLEPAASWFVNRKLPRWAATTLVFVIFLALWGAFVAAAIPPLAQQAGELISQAPHYIEQAQDHSSVIGRLNERFHLEQRITDAINSSGGSIFADVVSAGTAVFGFLADTLIVIVLTVYFLIDMPRIRTSLYRLVPHTRRPRVILIGDEVFAKVAPTFLAM